MPNKINDFMESIILEQPLVRFGLRIEKYIHHQIQHNVRETIEYPLEEQIWEGIVGSVEEEIMWELFHDPSLSTEF